MCGESTLLRLALICGAMVVVGCLGDPLPNIEVPARVVLVTSASEDFFPRLRNFVGSVHRWEPTLAIKVYDLGMSSNQLMQVALWENVELRKVPFDTLPGHFRNLRNYAWKPWVMNHSLYRDRFILYQDSGQELRQGISQVEQIIRNEGAFFVVQEGKLTKGTCCGEIGELVHDGTLTYLGVARESVEHKPMCAGGIQGYILGSEGHRLILEPTVKCMMEAACVTPRGASLMNHRFDQAVYSIYIAQAGWRCQDDPKFWANHFNNPGFPGGVSYDPEEVNNVILFTRRGIGGQGRGGPYYDYVKTRSLSATHPQRANVVPLLGQGCTTRASTPTACNHDTVKLYN